LFEMGDTARIEMRGGRITNVRTGGSIAFPPIPHHLVELLEAGGLVEKVKVELAQRKALAGTART
jgi:3-isopropylmalate/(R)-2-methylmalate dehydratase small subunit